MHYGLVGCTLAKVALHECSTNPPPLTLSRLKPQGERMYARFDFTSWPLHTQAKGHDSVIVHALDSHPKAIIIGHGLL